MSLDADKRYMDVGFFNIERKPETQEKTSSPFGAILATAAIVVLIVVISYCAGWRAGFFAAPCCLGPIDLQFEFEG